jgi:phosphoglycerate kinase
MKQLKDLSFEGKKVIIRVDFNVPLNVNGLVSDETRIKAALPTLNYILEMGGAIILLSHLGRPKNGPEEIFSLKQIIPNLSKLLEKEIDFSPESTGESAIKKANELGKGGVLLMENVRFHEGETKGDMSLAREFSKLGDIFINDAFGSAHRAHSSTTQIASFFEEKAPGFLMRAELQNAEKVLHNSKAPFLAIMGGAKVSDKIEIIQNLLSRVDILLIGGGMSYTFIKALGGKVGKSLLEEDKIYLAGKIIELAKQHKTKLILPLDSLVANEFSNQAKTRIQASNAIEDGNMGLDIGPEAIKEFCKEILLAKTILWNGPIGVFEFENFSNGTNEIGKAVCKATKKGAFSLIGGGDSAAAIKKLGLADQVSYVSTGGGALLEYFEGKQLPGVAALEN